MKEKFNTIVKESIWAVLKKNGFRRKGLNFYRTTNETQQILNIQKSRGNSTDNITFYINCGILIDQLTEEKRELKIESESDIHKRIRDISNIISLDGISINESIDTQRLSNNLHIALKEDVMLFFNNLSQKEKSIEYMVDNNGLFKYKKLLNYLSKNKQKDLVVRYIKNIKKILLDSGGEDRIPKFFERFLDIIKANNFVEFEILEELNAI